MKVFIKVTILLLGMLLTAISYASVNSDDYIKGYIQGLFIHNYGLPDNVVVVKNGYIFIQKDQILADSPENIVTKLKQATSHLKGIKNIILVDNKSRYASLFKNQQSQIKNEQDSKEYELKIIDGVMPTHSLFRALIADPKWPRFTLAYQYYSKTPNLRHAFAPNFGASFSLYRNIVNDIEYELGIQGGLFALMNIGESPSTLINADYFISIPFSYRTGPWSGLARLYHVSSHLGDEFLLSNEGSNINRINLSYEGIDVIFSYNFMTGFRLYGGGGYIIHKDPNYIKPLKFQAGIEYRSFNTLMQGRLRPVTGIDIKKEQMAKWCTGISWKGGVQIENSALISNEVQLMVEYYKGKSMHGQFYDNKISYVGIGIHAFL